MAMLKEKEKAGTRHLCLHPLLIAVDEAPFLSFQILKKMSTLFPHTALLRNLSIGSFTIQDDQTKNGMIFLCP
jgi:hypothetical protein